MSNPDPAYDREWTWEDISDTAGMSPEDAAEYRRQQEENLEALRQRINRPWGW